MKKILVLWLAFAININPAWAQISGNATYSESGAKNRAIQIERAKTQVSQLEIPPTATSNFVECNILMNVKADEYVAVFGVAHDGITLAECAQKMDSNVAAFQTELRNVGVAADAIAVDFITQTKTYGFELEDNIMKERHEGFSLKKNISIRYTDPTLLEKMTLAASKLGIYDLVKVDYIVTDITLMQDKLMAEAAKIIKRKAARYETLLDVKLQAPAQVYAEKYAIHYPTQMYDSYVAQETESLYNLVDRNRYVVQGARKSRTVFFNGLDADGFDSVINPVNTEPMVQFTLYLKMKYEVKQPDPK